MIHLQSTRHDLISYDKIRTKEEYINHLMHRFAYEQAAKICANKTVLDLGCNTGFGTSLISKLCTRIIGADISPRAIAKAKSQYQEKNLEFIHIDGNTIPVADQTFDVILSFQVLEHIVDYGVFLGEIKRVLAPRGVVIMTTPNSKIRLDAGMPPWYPFHVREFSSDELQALLLNYFSHVRVFGLLAEKTLYAIEINRLNRVRESFRRRSQAKNSLRGAIRERIDKLIPAQYIFNLKRVFTVIQNRILKTDSPFTISNDFIDRHSTADLFYTADNLESALDLLAICSTDKFVQDIVTRSILENQVNSPST